MDIFCYNVDVPRPLPKRVRDARRREQARFNRLVADHVESSGLSEEQLAKQTRWSLKRVQRILAGKTYVSALDMATLARVLDKPVGDLFTEPGGAR